MYLYMEQLLLQSPPGFYRSPERTNNTSAVTFWVNCSMVLLQSLTAEPPVTQEVLKTDVQIKFMIQENMTSENLLFLFEHQIKCVCIRVCVCVCSSVFSSYLIF